MRPEEPPLTEFCLCVAVTDAGLALARALWVSRSQDHSGTSIVHVASAGRPQETLCCGPASDSVQLLANTTVARAPPDGFVEVAANASLDTGSVVYSLQLLADGRLTVGTKTDGEQLFAYAPVARARLGSRMQSTPR